MKILNVLAAGKIGGIEILCKDTGFHSDHSHHFCFLWSGGKIAEEMITLQLSVEIIGINRTLSYDAVRCFKKLVALVKQEKYDCIIFHHASPLMWVFFLLLKKQCPFSKFILYVHGCYQHYTTAKFLKRVMLKHLFQFACNHADGVIAISQTVKESVVKNISISPDKITTIYNGVELSRFSPVFCKTEKCRKLIYVGRLIREKGVQIILEALSLLPPQSQYEFQIVGEGSYKDKLVEKAMRLGLSEKVVFWGASRQIPMLLAGSDIFLHIPILQEGFGITVIEAMASGLLCICAKSGAIPEIITHGENGLLVEQNNPVRLAEVLREAMDGIDSAENQRLRRNALKRAADFSITNYVTDLDSYIQTAVNNQ